ncbi:transposable element Tcb1 transposase [Trichonephila clavipes]|nr:transposable element Tcb1 transposase [Trichonephila clavipes]
MPNRRGRSHLSRYTTAHDDSNGSRSHITNHSTTHSVFYASFCVRSYHSMPFAKEWKVFKASIVSFTLDWKPQACAYIQRLLSAIFQQDNSRLHGVCNVQKFFFTHQIELLPSPACSPDLSPMENVWSVLAQLLTRDTPLAATPDQLW